MIGASSFIPVLKYGFVTLVVSCAGYLIASITVLKHIDAESIDDLLVRHQISMRTEGAAGALDWGFEECLTRPSNVFCRMTIHRHLGHQQSTEPPENATTPKLTQTQVHPVTKILRSFTEMTREFNLAPVLLDPSLLYCMLSARSKVLLLANGFNPARLRLKQNSILMGIHEEGAQILKERQENTTDLQYNEASSIKMEGSDLQDDFQPTWFIYRQASAKLYLSAFQQQSGYLIRPKLYQEDSVLVKTDVAFENFSAVHIPNKLGMHLYLPSDPVHYLYQIVTSNFSACSRNSSYSFQSHPSLTPEQLENRAAVAFQELKALFHPYFLRFWLWGESLYGWVTDCNIFLRSTVLNVAALNSKLERLNLTEMFSGNEYLKLIPEFSFVDDKVSRIHLDCHGLKVDIFVAYEDGDSTRFYEDFSGNENKEGFVYPKSSLFSTDIFGQIVYIPQDSSKFFQRNSLPQV